MTKGEHAAVAQNQIETRCGNGIDEQARREADVEALVKLLQNKGQNGKANNAREGKRAMAHYDTFMSAARI